MKKPTKRFLLEMAGALRKAKHQNVAEHMAAGLMWAIYPEWFDNYYIDRRQRASFVKGLHEGIRQARGK